jgi:transposase
VPGGTDVSVPKKFPPEFKRDVVTVARRGDLTIAEVAADVDISVESVRRWMRQAEIDDGIKDLTTAEQSELVQLRREKRRLEMGNEILRRAAAYFAKDSLPNELPAGPGLGGLPPVSWRAAYS